MTDTMAEQDHEHWMREALREARRALAEGERPIGAVVVHDGAIVGQGQGHARHKARRSDLAHAEMNALHDAASYLREHEHEAVLYTTVEPCVMCLGAAVMADVAGIVYALADRWISPSQMMQMAYVKHHIKQYVGGVLEAESAALWEQYDIDELEMLRTERNPPVRVSTAGHVARGTREQNPKIRATAVLVEDGHILLVKQRVTESSTRGWSLPGGSVEWGETLEQCLRREMEEETGLAVAVERLLYVCERMADDRHVLHLTFAVRPIGGQLHVGYEPEEGAHAIEDARMVPLSDLADYGFSERFCRLARAGFPNAGTYEGSVENIGL